MLLASTPCTGMSIWDILQYHPYCKPDSHSTLTNCFWGLRGPSVAAGLKVKELRGDQPRVLVTRALLPLSCLQTVLQGLASSAAPASRPTNCRRGGGFIAQSFISGHLIDRLYELNTVVCESQSGSGPTPAGVQLILQRRRPRTSRSRRNAFNAYYYMHSALHPTFLCVLRSFNRSITLFTF